VRWRARHGIISAPAGRLQGAAAFPGAVMNEYDILLRVVSALVAGGLIGLERTHRGRAAGLRTYALVAMGSALLVATAQYAMGWAAPGRGDPKYAVSR
jgi:uncharacterized membrane protein YhiD involved in acid resistance